MKLEMARELVKSEEEVPGSILLGLLCGVGCRGWQLKFRGEQLLVLSW